MTSTLPPLVQAVAGAIGSASANGLVYPLDLVTTRLQLENQTGTKFRSGGLEGANRILRHIISKKGIAALYDGLSTDTGATLLSNFFYFYVYSFFREMLLRRQTPVSTKSGVTVQKLSMIQDLAVGFLAGVASRAISTPLNIVTLRLQTENERYEENGDSEKEETDSAETPGVVSVVERIYDEDGLKGFWKGFGSSVLLSLNPSLTLAFFQLFRRGLVVSKIRSSTPQFVLSDPTPKEAFVGAAFSNTIAVCLLYPLILAKTRLQARRKSPANAKRIPPTMSSVLTDAFSRPVLSKDGGKTPAKFAGLYQGLEMQLIKSFLSQGVTFLVKGRIEQFIVMLYLLCKARYTGF